MIHLLAGLVATLTKGISYYLAADLIADVTDRYGMKAYPSNI